MEMDTHASIPRVAHTYIHRGILPTHGTLIGTTTHLAAPHLCVHGSMRRCKFKHPLDRLPPSLNSRGGVRTGIVLQSPPMRKGCLFPSCGDHASGTMGQCPWQRNLWQRVCVKTVPPYRPTMNSSSSSPILSPLDQARGLSTKGGGLLALVVSLWASLCASCVPNCQITHTPGMAWNQAQHRHTPLNATDTIFFHGACCARTI